jgi:hypothetical protein
MDDLHTPEVCGLVFDIFVFKLQAELENLSTKLEECSLQYPAEKKPHNVQICTASVAMVTDTNKQGVENTVTLNSSIQRAVTWFHSGEVRSE